MQHSRFLQYTDDNFLTQVINEPTRGNGLLTPHAYKHGRAHKGRGQLSLQQLQDATEDPERKEQGNKWDHSPSTEMTAGEKLIVAY